MQMFVWRLKIYFGQEYSVKKILKCHDDGFCPLTMEEEESRGKVGVVGEAGVGRRGGVGMSSDGGII